MKNKSVHYYEKLSLIQSCVIILLFCSLCWSLVYVHEVSGKLTLMAHKRTIEVKNVVAAIQHTNNNIEINNEKNIIRDDLADKKIKVDSSQFANRTRPVLFNTIEIAAESTNNCLLQIGKMRDSMNLMKNQLIALNIEKTKVSDKYNNFSINIPNLNKFGNTSDDSNADLIITSFKQKGKSILSPAKNYIKITRKDSSLLVNNSKAFYTEQTNDEINQLSLQARSSYNFGSDSYSVGPGLELKISRTGINAAYLINPVTGKSGISLGLRVDAFRKRFK